ncbi:MAG: hypothetical protein AB2690_15180 [Candidatus Thiodiazotropha endolucinida]
MDINFILAFVFVAISAAIWVLLGFSVHGYERYQSVFKEQTESKLESLFLFKKKTPCMPMLGFIEVNCSKVL